MDFSFTWTSHEFKNSILKKTKGNFCPSWVSVAVFLQYLTWTAQRKQLESSFILYSGYLLVTCYTSKLRKCDFKSKQYTILIADKRDFPPLLSFYFWIYQFVLLIRCMVLNKKEFFPPISKIFSHPRQSTMSSVKGKQLTCTIHHHISQLNFLPNGIFGN